MTPSFKNKVDYNDFYTFKKYDSCECELNMEYLEVAHPIYQVETIINGLRFR